MIFLLLIPIILYGAVWAFMKKYQRIAGAGNFASAFYNMVGSCVSFVVLFCIKGFNIFWNVPTLICAITFGCGLVLYNGMKVKSASLGPLALISMSTTLGAVILTMLYGFIFLNEKVTVFKLISMILVFLSFVPIMLKQKGKRLSFKFLLCCVAVFFGNGILTTISKVGQQYTPDNKYTIDFIALYFFFSFVSAAVEMIPTLNKAGEIERKHVFSLPAIFVSAVAVGLNTMAALSNFYLAFLFDASVQYPIVNVGIMIFTTIMAFIAYSEKPNLNTIIGLILATASVIFMSLG